MTEKTKGIVIDIALEDTKLKRHWLHPTHRKSDARLQAIRLKNRKLHLAEQRMKRMAGLRDGEKPGSERK